ncbi:hypothetical protein ACRQ5D_05555 [Mucilaginibacter sp. P25]|uniref:hypothetical protein n=1 Tax=unclassified Mucilaginibacter TaxID=2617802 RepID=UPI003D6708FB
MKKLLMLLALACGLNYAANAQKKIEKTPAQKAANKTEHLQKNLKLTADQAKKSMLSCLPRQQVSIA